jgi:hypothetical protein
MGRTLSATLHPSVPGIANEISCADQNHLEGGGLVGLDLGIDSKR